MPYIEKRAQTEVGRKIEELAERLPYKEWYLPDPYSPTSYLMPIGGLTKTVGKPLSKVITELSTTPERSALFQKVGEGLGKLLNTLGVESGYLGGSIVSKKPNPKDVDIYLKVVQDMMQSGRGSLSKITGYNPSIDVSKFEHLNTPFFKRAYRMAKEKFGPDYRWMKVVKEE